MRTSPASFIPLGRTSTAAPCTLPGTEWTPDNYLLKDESIESTASFGEAKMVQQCSWISSRDPLNDFPPASIWSPSSTCSQMQRKASSMTCNYPFKAETPARPMSAWHCGIMTCCVHRKLEHHRALVNIWKALPASWELATDSVIYCPNGDDFERLVLLSSAHFTGTDVEAERGDRKRQSLELNSDLSASSIPFAKRPLHHWSTHSLGHRLFFFGRPSKSTGFCTSGIGSTWTFRKSGLVGYLRNTNKAGW